MRDFFHTRGCSPNNRWEECSCRGSMTITLGKSKTGSKANCFALLTAKSEMRKFSGGLLEIRQLVCLVQM